MLYKCLSLKVYFVVIRQQAIRNVHIRAFESLQLGNYLQPCRIGFSGVYILQVRIFSEYRSSFNARLSRFHSENENFESILFQYSLQNVSCWFTAAFGDTCIFFEYFHYLCSKELLCFIKLPTNLRRQRRSSNSVLAYIVTLDNHRNYHFACSSVQPIQTCRVC